MFQSNFRNGLFGKRKESPERTAKKRSTITTGLSR